MIIEMSKKKLLHKKFPLLPSRNSNLRPTIQNTSTSSSQLSQFHTIFSQLHFMKPHFIYVYIYVYSIKISCQYAMGGFFFIFFIIEKFFRNSELAYIHFSSKKMLRMIILVKEKKWNLLKISICTIIWNSIFRFFLLFFFSFQKNLLNSKLFSHEWNFWPVCSKCYTYQLQSIHYFLTASKKELSYSGF